MTASVVAPSGRVRAGWWVLVTTGVLLLANGVWLVTSVANPEVFASDAGVAMDAVAASYPTVVDLANVRGTLVGILLTGLAAVALVLAWGGLRTGSRVAWAALALVACTLAVLAAYALAVGTTMVATIYLVYAAAMSVGLALAADRGGR